MQLVPYYNEAPLEPERVLVQVNPEDLKRCHKLIERSKQAVPPTISNQQQFDLATRMAAQLKSLLNEIAVAKKLAKSPFNVVLEQINSAASGLTDLVETEHKNVLAVLSAYVAQLEAAKKEEERKRQEQLQLEQEEYARKIAEAKRLDDEQEMTRQQLEMELALEVADLELDPKRALVPGGRVDHRWKFALSDLRALIASGHINLLRCELDYYACLDEVRAQLTHNPNAEPVIAGVTITKEVSVSVRPNEPTITKRND